MGTNAIVNELTVQMFYYINNLTTFVLKQQYQCRHEFLAGTTFFR